MIDDTLIRDFLVRYGSTIEDAGNGRCDHGVLAPVRRYGAALDHVQYHKAGFEAASEYTLLTLNESGIVCKGARLYINEALFRVVDTDCCYYMDRPLYIRGYLHKQWKESTGNVFETIK